MPEGFQYSGTTARPTIVQGQKRPRQIPSEQDFAESTWVHRGQGCQRGRIWEQHPLKWGKSYHFEGTERAHRDIHVCSVGLVGTHGAFR